MKDIKRNAYFRIGRRYPQGPDLAFTKPTRDSFEMLHSSFQNLKSFLCEKNLHHIAEDICFSSFTTLFVEHFFAGMRTPSRPTPDMLDYATRRLSCLIESVQKMYNSSFSMYTGPQSHYTERKINKMEPEWLYDRAKKRQENFREEDGTENDVLRAEARELRVFATEFGRGVRQQRVRGKTKERAGTLPLALSMMRRVVSPGTDSVPDMIKELGNLDEEQPETTPTMDTRLVLFSKGDVIAVKHNWKCYLEHFFLALLCEDLPRSNDGILERTMQINSLEPSEEDPLIYIVGDEDDKNPPRCMLHIASVVQDGEKYLLSRNEEQRLKNLANGSNESDSESNDAEGANGDDQEDEDDQPTRFETRHSRSGRRVTRYLV